jgi:hypothetical protein
VIAALLIGREGSLGFPGKNVHPVLGRPLMEYPLIAAKGSRYIDATWVSTDSPRIKEISRGYGARIIDRPPELCTAAALGEHVFVHGYHEIRKALGGREGVELLVLLMCNAPTITSGLIDEGITALRAHPEYDSAVTVSRYNMYSPLRARRIGPDGLLHPFVPFEAFGDPETLNCDRDSQGDVWFADMGASVIRPRNLEHLDEGLLPQKWMGQRIHPLKQWGGLDIDYEWQIPQAACWIGKHGLGKEG